MSEDPPESRPPQGLLPSFDERRRRNDVAMVPDRGFTKQLKALDDELEVVWNWGQEFWEIWRFPKEERKKPMHLISVTTKGKTYRELGADVLLKLQQGMHLAEMPLEKLVRYFDELDEQVQRRRRQKFLDRIRDVADYTFELVMGIPIVQVPKSYKIGRVAHGSNS